MSVAARPEPAPAAIAAAVLATLGIAIYVLRLDHAAGLLLDDAWYMVLAKALAGGEGFRLISSSAAAIVPSVPPGFPALLSTVFWLSPSYPDNLIPLKMVSVLAMAGVAAACWYDFTRHRGVPRSQALWLVASVVLAPSFVFLATSTVMPEPVFTLAQLLTVIAVERALRRDEGKLRAAGVAGLLAGATVLVRTAGVAILAAGAMYFLARRQWRQASAFLVAALIVVAPWQWYARANAPTDEERAFHGGTIAYAYEQLLAMERPGAVNRLLTRGGLIDRVTRNAEDTLTRDVGGLIVPALFRGASESGQEIISVGRPGRGSMGGAAGTRIVSALLVLLMLAGAVLGGWHLALPVLLIGCSFVMIVSVGSLTIRYVLPLLPFLIVLLWHGIPHARTARIVMLVVLGFHLLDHGQYIRARHTTNPDWIAGATDVDEVIAWIDANLPEDAVVASSNPGLLYLRTGRKGIVSANYEENWETWRASGIRYVAALRRLELPRRRFNPTVLLKTDGGLWVVEM